MAQQGQKKSHRDRKNPHMADVYKEQRHAKNALRPKQERVIEESGKVIGPFR